MSKESITDGFSCPFCHAINKCSNTKWESVGYIPIICVDCGNLFWSRIPNDKNLVIVNRIPVFKTEIPDLSTGAWAIVIDKTNEYYLEPCKVLSSNKRRYKVQFNVGIIIWLSQHQIELLPWGDV
jgi:hypothetical protein